MLSNSSKLNDIFSFCNLSLSIPNNWYLSKTTGTFSEGTFDVSDNKEIKIKCWWSKKSNNRWLALKRFKKRTKQKNLNIPYLEKQKISEMVKADKKKLPGFYTSDALSNRDIFFIFPYHPSTHEIKKILSPLFNPLYQGSFSLFGSKFKIPNDYKLKECNLYSGLQEYKFSKEKGALTVWTISMARELLKNKDPEHWVLDFINQKHKKRYVFEPIQKHNGYNAIFAKRRLRWSLSLKELFSGYPNTQLIFKESKNKLYVFLFLLKNKQRHAVMDNVVLGDLFFAN